MATERLLDGLVVFVVVRKATFMRCTLLPGIADMGALFRLNILRGKPNGQGNALIQDGTGIIQFAEKAHGLKDVQGALCIPGFIDAVECGLVLVKGEGEGVDHRSTSQVLRAQR